jgi:hypothetical protein
MKKKEEPKRNYPCSDATLKQSGDELIGCAKRDADEFATRGISEADMDTILDDLNDFANLRTDEELEGDVGIAVQNRNEARDVLDNKLNTLKVAAERKWGVDDARYKKYAFGALTDYNDDEFYRFAKRALRTATEQAADLASKGIDAAFLTDLTNKIKDFDDLIDSVGVAEKERNVSTQIRVDAGNSIYAKLVEVASVGKDIWHDVNEAKYNDYVLENYFGENRPDMVKTGNVAANGKLYLNTNNAFISSSTQFTLEVPPNIPAGSVITVQYSNIENGDLNPARNFREMLSQNPAVVCTAAQLGLDKTNGFTFLMLYANNQQGGFKITIKQ